jgi:hypothetical protein
MYQTHHIIKLLCVVTSFAMKIESERLGIFYPAPEAIAFSILIAEDRDVLNRKICP